MDDQQLQFAVKGRERAQHRIRTLPSQLKLGHMVAQANVAWSETPYPDDSGLMLDTFEQKKWFVDHCRWVVIDLHRSRNRTRPPARYVQPLMEPLPNIPARLDALQNSRLGPEQLRRAWRLYGQLEQRTAQLLRSFNQRARLDLSLVNTVVSQLADGLPECLAGLIWLTRIKEAGRYTAQHVINTAILSMGWAHAMGWERERIETAGQVGMLHDIGKVRLDDALLNKKGPLNDEEMRAVRRHVIVAYDLLKTHRGMSLEVLSAVRSSHERPDGQGYPRGLSGNAIPVLARLIAVVDAYDAMASYRPHGDAVSHQQALGELWRSRGSQFEPALVEAFIQFLGWVPPGTLVRLNTGDLAVVMRMQRNGQVRPVVRVVHQEPDRLALAEEIELAGEFATEKSTGPGLAEILPDGSENVSMRALTGLLMEMYEADTAHVDVMNLSAGLDQSGENESAQKWRFSGLRALIRPSASDAGKPAAAAGSSRSFRVLVVEDALTVREMLNRALKQAGHRVDMAKSGEEALEKAIAEPPDAIFLDILLPGMNGFATLRRIRKIPALAKVPVVMVSGNAEAAEQFFFDKIGADDFLPKPFSFEDVNDCVQRLVVTGRLGAVADDV